MTKFLHHFRVAAKYFVCVLAVMFALCGAAPVRAHNLPLSYVDLRADKTGVDVTVEASAKNLAHELSGMEEEVLLTTSGALAQSDKRESKTRIALSRRRTVARTRQCAFALSRRLEAGTRTERTSS